MTLVPVKALHTREQGVFQEAYTCHQETAYVMESEVRIDQPFQAQSL